MKKNINQTGVISDGSCSFEFDGTIAATAASRSQINLSWSAVTGATSYMVQRDTSSSFTSPATVYSGSSTSSSSTGLATSTQYYYRVSAVIDGDTSNWSSSANATTLEFAAPANLATTVVNADSISLSWSAVSGAVNYKLQRSTNSSFTSPVETTIAGGTTTATTTGLSASTSYYYRINVTDSDGTSSWSGTLSTATRAFIVATINSSQSWTVPAGITSVKLESWGAQGGNGGTAILGYTPYSGGSGGLGGYGRGTLATTPGSVLTVVVGAQGSSGSDAYSTIDCGASNPADNGLDGGESYVKTGATFQVRGYGGGGGEGGGFYYQWDGGCDDYYTDGAYGGSNGSSGGGYANTGTLTSTTTSSGTKSGNGQVKITY